jgi:hypothetical protein
VGSDPFRRRGRLGLVPQVWRVSDEFRAKPQAHLLGIGLSGRLLTTSSCPALIEAGHPAFVRWRGCRGIAAVTRLRATHGGRLDTVGGRVGRGRPSSSRRTSLGDSTPASRPRCRLAQRASGSSCRRSRGRAQPAAGTAQGRRLDQDGLPEFECNRNCLGPAPR